MAVRRILRVPALALLLAATAALSACGAPPATAPAATHATALDESQLTDAPIVPSGAVAGLTSTRWRLVHSSPSSRVLEVRADQGDGCDRPAGLTVAERPGSVTIRSLLHEHAVAGPCLDYLYQPLWRVTLAAPLGDRSVLHAP